MLFLVLAVTTSKSLANNDIPPENGGVLGGPVAAVAIQSEPGHSSMNPTLGTEDPAGAIPRGSLNSPVVDLSTGTLDGTLPFQAPEGQSPGGASSLLEDNQKAIKAVVALADSGSSESESTAHYFIQPASGKNWGVLHEHNAVDIANSCGTPVISAAAGKVISDASFGSGASGWNGGFGKFVLIKHANGTKTRYAHLSEVSVTVGDEVKQGEEIGRIGNTGNVQGSTGCHLHFEVIGGVNPFVHK